MHYHENYIKINYCWVVCAADGGVGGRKWW